MQAAIGIKNDLVNYSGKDEQSYQVNDEGNEKGIKVKSITLNSFLEEMKLHIIDFMKMDIEGSEYPVLLEDKEKSWLQKVKSISIEVHDTVAYKKEEGLKKIITELENNNFKAWKSSLHWSSVFGVNKSFVTSGL